MKLLVILSALVLVGCGPNPEPVRQKVSSAPEEGCIVNTSSKLVAKQQVGKITNLILEEEETGIRNICTARFDITVDGKSYHVEKTESGLEQMASICYYAREKGRKELLLELGGNFRSETVVKCHSRDKIG